MLYAPGSPHYYYSSPVDNSSTTAARDPAERSPSDIALLTVLDAIKIPEALIAEMTLARSFRKDPLELVGHKYSHIRYVTDVLRPYAEMIFTCIPSTVLAPEHFPMGRIDFLKPHVIEYICQCALLDSIAQEYARIHNQEPFLHPSMLWLLSLAETFDILLGRPGYGYEPQTRETFLSRRISELMEEECQNEWSCVNALLEEVELSGRLGPVLNKVENHISNGYALNPSGPYLRCGETIGYHIFPMVRFFPPLYMPQRTVRAFAHQERLLVPDLVVLWVNRARHLAQQLHAATTITDPDNVPRKTVGLIREAIRVLLENMVILAKASHAHGVFGSEERPEFFVPAECTTLMGIAERFVDLYSYDGDDDDVAQASLFDNLCIVYGCIVINPEDLEHPIDFPHFEVREEHLLLYGMYDFIKRKQLGAVLSNSCLGGRTFGEKLRCYNPDLPEADVYKFADPLQGLGANAA
ncbi:hypothetical protein C8R44DRAFT_738149 [Mycena epipterygia]|nr:hypothetical protein C8R44DRAFT_738149 [Mycena epipterygia]